MALLVLLVPLGACRPAAAADEASETSAAAALTATVAAEIEDAFDPSKMDFESPADVVTNGRHAGPFASWDALNRAAAVEGR